jgi:two-component system, chemotaxis family, response regulator WspF
MSSILRVGIVNDMPLALEAIRRVVASRPDLRVAWAAPDGAAAIARCREDRPDVLLMDMVMPGIDGVEATRRIMRESPCPILVVTATVEGNASLVYDALGAGAVDAVQTPVLGPGGEIDGGLVLLRKLAQVARLGLADRGVRSGRTFTTAPVSMASPSQRCGDAILAIGASTGGPTAIAKVLEGLQRPVTVPVIVVQHLGADYMPGLATWIAKATGLRTTLVSGPMPLAPGTVYLGSGDRHLVCDTARSVTVREEPSTSLHKPSIDVLFHSLRTVGLGGVAVLLTGMGRDGAEGLLALKRAGWWTIAQDRASSIVWGMPGEAHRLGAASELLGVGDIPWAIDRAFARRANRTLSQGA